MNRTFTPRLGPAVLERLEAYADRFRSHFNRTVKPAGPRSTCGGSWLNCYKGTKTLTGFLTTFYG